jgi:ribosomal protein L5
MIAPALSKIKISVGSQRNESNSKIFVSLVKKLALFTGHGSCITIE